MKLRKETICILEDLERRLDADVEADVTAQWEDFLMDRFQGDIFTPCRRACTQPGVELPNIHINDAQEDPDLMVRMQLAGASRALADPKLIPCIRADYSSGIMSSLFGAEVFVMPREMNCLPTTRAFNDTEKMREILQKGMPSLTGGLGQKVFDFGEICAEAFEKYPKVKKYVYVYHPDTQGPLDIAELMWGGEMFYAMYDEPELVHGVLDLISRTYTAFMEKWFAIWPGRQDINPHWGNMWHKGRIVLRDDSAMNLSPALYAEYAAPCDSALLEHFGGGAVHFCGRGDHYMETLCACPWLTAINLSQPHLNDMETIYRNTVDKGIKLLMFDRTYAQKDMERPGGLGHCVHCL